MTHARSRRSRRSILAALGSTVALAAALTGVGQRPAAAAVTAVRGSACGYITNVGLFGGPQAKLGCAPQSGTSSAPANASTLSPSVALATNASNSPQSATDADGALGKYGPAAIFSGIWPFDEPAAPPSGPISVATQGSTGVNGSVSSSAHITLRTDNNPSWPGGFGPGPVEGDELHSSCSATETGVSGSTTFVNGILTTTTTPDGSPLDTEPIPNNPPVNYTRSGVISNVGDVFAVVFNEQIVNADGSLTVNAFHMYLFGPVAIGESIGGQVTCGVTPTTVTPNDTVDPTCGIPVVEPMGPEDPTPRVPRVERIGAFDAGGLKSIFNKQIVNGNIRVGDPSSSFTYLQFVPNQKGPLAITATRSNEALPMYWSFDAKDKAGNVTHCAGLVPGPTYLSVADAVVSEGNTGTVAATFTVTRSGYTGAASSVSYTTVAGTAVAPADYTALALTTMSFAAGETSKTVDVLVKGDTIDEANETFLLKLSSPVGATLSDKKGKATIVDNEGAITPGPTTFLSVNDLSVTEGHGTPANNLATFTITRSGNTSGTSTVQYATANGTAVAPGDYTAKSLTTVTFTAGQTTKTVSVTVIGETVKEPNETFLLNLSGQTAADLSDPAGTATVVSDD